MSCKLKLAYDGQLDIFNYFLQSAYWSIGPRLWYSVNLELLFIMFIFYIFVLVVFHFGGFQVCVVTND